MNTNSLTHIIKQFKYYKHLGEQTFEQLKEQDLFWEANAGCNSIALIVQHLCGNMQSRWTDFLTSDGEKEWRDRDSEFELSIQSQNEVLQKWDDGWACLFNALMALKDKDMNKIILIRNQRHTVAEALDRQMMHYAYHIGQIVMIGKIVKGEAWQSLSIAKGTSKEYNQNKFSQGPHGGHFSEEKK